MNGNALRVALTASFYLATTGVYAQTTATPAPQTTTDTMQAQGHKDAMKSDAMHGKSMKHSAKHSMHSDAMKSTGNRNASKGNTGHSDAPKY